MLKTILANNDFDPIVAKDGKAGSHVIYNDEDVQAVICDIMMPVSDGFDFLEKTKAIREEKNIPVCMLTAMEDSQNIVRSLEAGANDYMVKPIDKEILIEKLNLLLNSGKQQTFSTCKADFPVTLHTFDQPLTAKALNEMALIVEMKGINIELSDVFKIEHCLINELTGISEFIVKTTKITEIDGTKAAKLDFIGLSEAQRRTIRSITIKGIELTDKKDEEGAENESE